MADRAIELFHGIQNPDEVILVLLFNACAQLESADALALVKNIASNMSSTRYSSPRLITSLVDALMKCGDMRHARCLFDASTRKDLPM